MNNTNEGNNLFFFEPKWAEPFRRSLKSWMKLWWLFFLAGFIGAIAGFIYASQQQKKYKSRLSFALEEGRSNNFSSLYNLASQFGISMGSESGIFSGDNIVPILKSRRIIESVLTSVDTFNNSPRMMIDYYLEISNNGKETRKSKKINFPVNQLRDSFSPAQDSVLFSVYKTFFNEVVSVERPDKRLSIYEINVITPDEKFTHDFTSRILDSTNKFYTSLKTQKFQQTLDVLQKRATVMKENLNESLSEKAAVQDKNLNPAFSNADVPVLKQQMGVQTYGAAYAELFKNVEIARIQYLNNFPLIQIIDDVRYPLEPVKRGRLKTSAIGAISSAILIFAILWAIRVLRALLRYDKDASAAFKNTH